MFDNCFSIYLDFFKHFKHENELEIQRLTQQVLDLEVQVSETREREMEATRELQQEKLRSTHQRVDSEGSEEDPDHWNIYKTQLESICQSLQYLIQQYQDQLFSGMRYLVRKWKRATRVGSPVMGGTVDLQQGYALNSNSFSPSRMNGFGPFNSHTSSPLHSSVHQSPYSPSYLSSSFTLRDLLNGASPYHSLGGASSGYHVNSNGVTNGNSPYQSVGGISDSYHVNSNFSVHTTPPTRDYSSKPHPTSENSGARRKILSSSSPTPTKIGHSSPARRVRISEPSSHDDYISRLENLQQRLSGMDSGECE
uniref:Uncharacterized protein n=1 Tax=Magallana gigas TaxID=29159 RepID=A0A8W8MAD8_MAGGI